MEMYEKEAVMRVFDYELGTHDETSNDLFEMILNAFRKVVDDHCVVDAEVVVRCKDCRWWNNSFDCPESLWCDNVKTKPDDFCSHGAKK